MNTPSPHDNTNRWPVVLHFLKQCNQVILGWAASLTWFRLGVLAVITMMTFSIIGDKLGLQHGRETVKVAIESNDEEPESTAPMTENIEECANAEIHIGNKKFAVVCESTVKVMPGATASAPANGAASAPAGGASGVTPGVGGEPTVERQYDIKVKPIAAKKTEFTTEKRVSHTLGGFIGDISSALFIALFAYLITAKIIVRKTVESDAKVAQATRTAEHEALERQLVQARLKLLQAQVEPHFLFNTLAAVDYLIETDPPRASVMQKQLITYLRGALPQMREDSSTLGRELSLVRAYLELLKMRIEDRLEYVIDVSPSLSGAVFPPMMLQSIIENAIKHGIEPKPEGGKITVQAQARDGSLWVDVVDTGVGLPEGDVFGKSTNGTGLGLENIRRRLALLYPNASRIELRSEIPSGTSVRIMVPYQTTPNAPTAGAR